MKDLDIDEFIEILLSDIFTNEKKVETSNENFVRAVYHAMKIRKPHFTEQEAIIRGTEALNKNGIDVSQFR